MTNDLTALLAWINQEIEDEQAMQDTINIDHQNAEIDAWKLHDANIVRLCQARAAIIDARRYRYLRERDLDAIDKGGIFVGQVPENCVVNGEDLDVLIDHHISC